MDSNKENFAKEKNLLDIQYQRFLNYFNIAAIFGLTTLFTVIWAFILKQVNLNIASTAVLIAFPVFLLAIWFVNKKLKEINKKIKQL